MISEKKPLLLNNIVTFTRWQVVQPNYILQTYNFEMYDAEFLVDFGPWKKGDKPYVLGFNIFTGRIYEGNNWDETVKDCVIQVVPKEEI